MPRTRERTKGRKERGSFIAVPKQILESPQYAKLSAWSVKLLIDIYAQYNGKNNGDLCAAWSVMKPKGWKSKGTLSRAVTQLLQTGFLIQTRQGGKHKASLYAVSFQPVDECGGKLEVASTVTAPATWKLETLPRISTNVPPMCTNSESYPQAN